MQPTRQNAQCIGWTTLASGRHYAPEEHEQEHKNHAKNQKLDLPLVSLAAQSARGSLAEGSATRLPMDSVAILADRRSCDFHALLLALLFLLCLDFLGEFGDALLQFCFFAPELFFFALKLLLGLGKSAFGFASGWFALHDRR